MLSTGALMVPAPSSVPPVRPTEEASRLPEAATVVEPADWLYVEVKSTTAELGTVTAPALVNADWIWAVPPAPPMERVPLSTFSDAWEEASMTSFASMAEVPARSM